jgi:hypothetical protein
MTGLLEVIIIVVIVAVSAAFPVSSSAQKEDVITLTAILTDLSEPERWES